MKNNWDPARLDVRAFAKATGRLSGHLPLTEMPRLFAEQPAGDDLVKPVHWQFQAELKNTDGLNEQIWMHLQAQASPRLICQRCLNPLTCLVQVDRRFRFVADEATALAEDEESEEDLLVISKTFNAFEWIEDELILDLPLIPLHQACPQPLPMATEELEKPHPFASLAALKKAQSPNKS